MRKVIPGTGWVTLSDEFATGKPLVTKEVGFVPPNLRQQYKQQWRRRQCMDSQRERERAIAREEEQRRDEKLARELNAQVSSRMARREVSPYLQELWIDPKGIGFAYGGIYPGRLHGHGRLHETHSSITPIR